MNKMFILLVIGILLAGCTSSNPGVEYRCNDAPATELSYYQGIFSNHDYSFDYQWVINETKFDSGTVYSCEYTHNDYFCLANAGSSPLIYRCVKPIIAPDMNYAFDVYNPNDCSTLYQCFSKTKAYELGYKLGETKVE